MEAEDQSLHSLSEVSGMNHPCSLLLFVEQERSCRSRLRQVSPIPAKCVFPAKRNAVSCWWNVCVKRMNEERFCKYGLLLSKIIVVEDLIRPC